MDIDCLGTALLSLGLKNSNISIISENRYEWGVCYLSIVNGTGVAVPMDKYLPKQEAENLITRGKVEAIFYSPAFHEMMKELSETNTDIKHYICMEKLLDGQNDDKRFLSLPDLIAKGQVLLRDGDRSFTDITIDEKKMSVLLFTSGTTSMSKGVMLSHSNIASNITAVTTIIHSDHNDVHLSLLPLHHTFENTIGLLHMVHKGICIAYPDGIKYIAQNLKEYNVTLLVAVPAILEVIYKRMMEGIKKAGKERQFVLLVKVSQMLRSVGIDLRRKLFKRVLSQLGPNLRIAVSGAAPLNPEVILGFDKIGLRMIEGYGLTETSPLVAANNDFISIPGTVGYPVAGVDVSIDSPDENGMGEIIVRGSNVMLGYYEDPQATDEAIDEEGWFKTGDLGFIDENGIIKITGRAKSMIVFTNGKKAFPEEYEALLNNIPGVKESFVWGNKAPDGDIQVCAKLLIDKEQLGIKEDDIKFESEIDKLSKAFDAAIKEINKNIPQYKIIRYFIMTTEEFVKTTTLKVKRPVEHEKTITMLQHAGIDMRKANGELM